MKISEFEYKKRMASIRAEFIKIAAALGKLRAAAAREKKEAA